MQTPSVSPSAGRTVQRSTDPKSHLQPRGRILCGVLSAEHKGGVFLPLPCLPGSRGSAELNRVSFRTANKGLTPSPHCRDPRLRRPLTHLPPIPARPRLHPDDTGASRVWPRCIWRSHLSSLFSPESADPAAPVECGVTVLHRPRQLELLRSAESESGSPSGCIARARAARLPAGVHPTFRARGALAPQPVQKLPWQVHVAASYRGLRGARAQVLLPLPSVTRGGHDWPRRRRPRSSSSRTPFLTSKRWQLLQSGPESLGSCRKRPRGVAPDTGLGVPPLLTGGLVTTPRSLSLPRGTGRGLARGVPDFVSWTTVAVSFEQRGSGQ